MDCRERNEEGETMEEGVRNIPGDERDCRRRRSLRLVAAEGEHSVAAWLEEVGFRFRDYLGFFFKSLFIATSNPTKRTPHWKSVKGAIKARLNHASPEKRTPFRCFALFLTPQRVFAAPRLNARPTNAFKNTGLNITQIIMFKE